jgi:hypothetical protein
MCGGKEKVPSSARLGIANLSGCGRSRYVLRHAVKVVNSLYLHMCPLGRHSANIELRQFMHDMRLSIAELCKRANIDQTRIPGFGQPPPSRSASPSHSGSPAAQSASSAGLPMASLHVSDARSAGSSSTHSSARSNPVAKRGTSSFVDSTPCADSDLQ